MSFPEILPRSCSNAYLRLALGGLLLAGLPTRAQAPAPPGPAAPALDARLPALLADRATLTRRYAEANAQRHSLFGNKPSKNDLQEVVDALQGIVDKDQQIVDVLNTSARTAQSTAARLTTTTTQLQTTNRDDRNLTSQRLSELEGEAQNLRQREKQQLLKQRDLAAEVAELRQSRLWRDGLIAALAVACVGLLLRRRRK